MHCKNKYPYLYFTIEESITIEDFLKSFHLSKKTIHLYKQNKEVLLNDEYVNFDTIMNKGDILKVVGYQEDDHLFPATYGELDVIYEDDYILIVNKPAFINVYPDDLEKTDSLCNIVSYYYKKKRLNIPVRYIHRLDYDTTGLVLFVKCSFVQPMLDYMLKTKEIHRDYLALVEGNMKVGSTKKINASISNDRHHNNKMRVGKNGVEAHTICKCIKSDENYSLVECKLLTGRKHQIRVHLSYIGHPIVGDKLYGHNNEIINHQALHGYQLSFHHPISKEDITVTCDVPIAFQQLLDQMKR